MGRRIIKRQKEFARLYASGLTAHEAARWAGYSSSTIQTNVGRLLASKRVAALIDRYQGKVRLVSGATARQCAGRLAQMLDQEPDEDRALRITRLLVRLYVNQGRKGGGSLSEARELVLGLRPEKSVAENAVSDRLTDSNGL